MAEMAGSVYVFCPRAVLQAAAALGVDQRGLLRDARIKPELLRSPGERIPMDQYLKLYQLALERTGWGRSNLESLTRAAEKAGITITKTTSLKWMEKS